MKQIICDKNRKRLVAWCSKQLAVVAIVAAPIGVAVIPTTPPQVPTNCDGHAHTHTAQEHRRFAKAVFSHYRITRLQRAKHRHMVRCAALPVGARAMVKQWKAGKKHHHRKFYWRIEWDKLSSADRAWVRSTAACESGGDPRTNTGNGFYGLLQFTLSTWAAAGGRGLPSNASYYEQAVRGVRWRNIAGSGQWPVCG